jgi:hypothetical protein
MNEVQLFPVLILMAAAYLAGFMSGNGSGARVKK